MVLSESPEQSFLQHLPVIDRIADAFARRLGLRGDDAADFRAQVRLTIIQDDYAVLRKFRGESSLATYLTVVVAMFARDYRASRWGRWRPSLEARRRGEVAVRLETLTYRDGLPVHQAGEMMRTAGETELSDAELARLLSALPRRLPLRPREVDSEVLDTDATRAETPRNLADPSVELESSRVEKALESAVKELDVDDRLLIRMRYWEGLSVATIARILGTEQKPLYRRIERLLEFLRKQLATSGVDRHDLHELLEVRA